MSPAESQGRIRWGLIGAGRIGKAYVESASLFPRNEFAWCADPAIPERPSYQAALEAASIDAALVCTPPNLHFDICADLLDRGVPTLCEKPVALAARQARTLVDRAVSTGTLFSQPAKFRGVPEVMRARELLMEGALGELRQVEVHFAGVVDMTQRWNSNRGISGGGVLMDNGSHAVDLIRYFAGPIVAVRAGVGEQLQPVPVEDSAWLEARTVQGVQGKLFVSWSHPPEQADYLRLTGTRATVAIGWRQSTLTEGTNIRTFGKQYDKLYSLGVQLERFARRTPMVTAEEAAATVAVIEAGYRSIGSTAWEPVEQ